MIYALCIFICVLAIVLGLMLICESTENYNLRLYCNTAPNHSKRYTLHEVVASIADLMMLTLGLMLIGGGIYCIVYTFMG